MKKFLLLALAVVFIAALFVGCAPAGEETSSAPSESASAQTDTDSQSSDGSASAEDDSLQKIMDKGEFIMGMDVSFPPMGFKDEEGNLTGFDVELAQAVAEHMGVKVNLQAIDWNAKEMELNTGTIDVIWNGYTITPERQEQVLMSEPYMENAQVIVVRADSDINSLADVAGKTLGVQDGSSAEEAVNADEEFASSIGKTVKFDNNVMALMDLANGQVDAVAVDSVVADYYSAQTPDTYKILDETLAPEEYGIGFRKGDEAFMNAVMDALKEMKEDGTAAEISNKWFGRDVTTF